MNLCDVECEVCPYDKSHMILKSRMLNHLAKCSKNFPDAEKVPCMYNKKHVVPVVEIKYHHASCPDKIKLDTYTMKVGEVSCVVKEELPINIDMPAAEENWDETPVGESVLNKIREVGDKPIIVTNSVIGKSKSKRKEMRRNEILRHMALEENQNSNVRRSPFVAAPEKKVVSTEPLRYPTETSNISIQISNILKKKEENMKSATAAKNVGEKKKVEEVPKSNADHNKSVVKLSEDIKQKINISSKASEDGSVSSRLSELSSKSYASFLAERQKAIAQNEYKKSLNNVDTKTSADDGMQVLTSKIFEKGPRGRGRTDTASPASSLASTSSTITDINLMTDEHGFLYMPVPGKGRGKIIH